MLYFYLQNPFFTGKSIKIPLFCRTKRTSKPKMPYFYLQKPFFTGKSIQIPLFCRTKRTSDVPWASKTLWRPHRIALGRPLGLKNALASAQNRSRSEKSIGIPLFCRTKRTSEPKMPYFYLKKKAHLTASVLVKWAGMVGTNRLFPP